MSNMYIIKLVCGTVEDGHYNVTWNKQTVGRTEYCLECCKHQNVMEVYHKPEYELMDV